MKSKKTLPTGMNLKNLLICVGMGLLLGGLTLYAQPSNQLSDIDHKFLTDSVQTGDAAVKLLAEIREKTEKGDPESEVRLGRAFDMGCLGLAEDRVEGLKWYRKAADQNYAVAEFTFGNYYYFSCSNYLEAVKWYRRAAVTNHGLDSFRLVQSCCNLGNCYANGQGVPQDYTEAAKWYRKAADQGNPTAQFTLGLYYGNGQGVPQDYAKALEWYRKAAQQGEVAAQCNLGLMYDNGDGVPQDYAEALQWYRKAAERGEADAQNNLGVMYNKGKGVPQNYVEAYKWYHYCPV